MKKKAPKAVSNLDYLTLLSRTKKRRDRKKLLDFANKDQIEAIAECIYNVLNDGVQLNDTSYNQLKKHAKSLRYVANKRNGWKQKKEHMKQSGGFLGTLIPLAIGAISNLIPSIIDLAKG